MEEPKATVPALWIEVSNIAFYALDTAVAVQLKSVLDPEQWFKFDPDKEKIKPLADAVKEKRLIHASIAVSKKKPAEIEVADLRVSFSAPRVS